LVKPISNTNQAISIEFFYQTHKKEKSYQPHTKWKILYLNTKKRRRDCITHHFNVKLRMLLDNEGGINIENPGLDSNRIQTLRNFYVDIYRKRENEGKGE